MNLELQVPAGRRWDATCIGLNASDHLITVAHYPPADGKMPFEGLVREGGGQAASAAALLGAWGCRTRYVGTVGSDRWGEETRRSLWSFGVDVSGLKVIRGAGSQVSYIILDRTRNTRTVFWHRDRKLALKPRDIRDRDIAASRLILLDCHDLEAAIRAAKLARRHGTLVLLDIEKVEKRTLELLKNSDVVIGSRSFAKGLGRGKPLRAVLSRLARLGVQVAIITLGKKGCVGLAGLRFFEHPGYPARTVDTTGAGDIYHGAFAFGILRGWPLQKILDDAHMAAAISTETIGVRNAIPSLARVRHRHAKARGRGLSVAGAV